MNPLPAITFITPTFRRPTQLLNCIASVDAQNMGEHIQHLVLPDYVGHGIAGMYQEVEMIAPVVRGEYVHLLADDDVLASDDAVHRLLNCASEHGWPEVIIVGANKGGLMLPLNEGEPQCGRIDLSCIITRKDVWQTHAGFGHYGKRYEGDFDFVKALWDAKRTFHFETRLLFVIGGVSHGRAEHTCTPESHDALHREGALLMTRTFTCPQCFQIVERKVAR